MVGVADSSASPPAASATSAASVDRLWLAQLHRISDGVAHELRNALNGVAVNLEVVRSRSEREGVTARSLASFAGSAAEQLELVIAVTEALVALARPARAPATIGRVADQVLAVLRPPLVVLGGQVRLEVEGEGSTRVPPDVARLLVAASLTSAAATVKEAGDVLLCRVRPGAGVRMEVAGQGPIGPLDDDVLRVAAEWSVTVGGEGAGITLTFPA